MVITPPVSEMNGAFDVRGKNVVVTGGNRGIGRGITTAFAQAGANIAILCRDVESGLAVRESIEQHGRKYIVVKCDVSDNGSVKEAAGQVLQYFGSIDVLVNNAGVATKTPFFFDDGLEEWRRVIDTNLHGVANVVHAFAPSMRELKRGGAIINISSVGGQRVSNSREHDNAPYSASKAAVDIFSKYLAVVLGDYGIRVNVIAPGLTHSDLDKDLPPTSLEMVEKSLPAHRFGEPIEIGALCVFLASPAGVHITGAVIPHDGGLLTII